MVLSLITKGIVFIRDVTLANFYGAGSVTDAFLISITIPSLFFALLGSAIKASYVPMTSKIKVKGNNNAKNQFTSGLLKLGAFFSLILILVTYLYPEIVLNLFASGFDEATKNLTIDMLKITILSMFLSMSIELLSGHLQSEGYFLIQTISSIPMNLLMLFFVVLSKYTSIYVLPIGYIVSLATHLIIILYFSFRSKFKFTFKGKILTNNVKTFLFISLPIFISSGVSEISQIIDKSFASNLGSGVISALDYASKIASLTQSIVVVSIGIVILPLLSDYYNNNDRDEYLATIKKSNILTYIIVFPIMIVSLVFAEDIVKFLYQRGQFQKEAVMMTSLALFYYSISLLSRGIKQTYYRAFYAMSNTRIPMYNSLLSIIINIILNTIFFNYTDLGIIGIALSTSISILISGIILVVQFHKEMGLKVFSYDIKSYSKIIISTLLSVGISYIFNNNIQTLIRSEEHTSELQSRPHLVCRLLLEK